MPVRAGHSARDAVNVDGGSIFYFLRPFFEGAELIQDFYLIDDMRGTDLFPGITRV